MTMLTLVLWSCALSLLSFALYLLKPLKGNILKIPSWYLGHSKRFQKVKLNPPPLLPWLVLFLLTACLGYGFFQKEEPFNDTATSWTTLVWVDTSWPALTSVQKPFENISEEIATLTSNSENLKFVSPQVKISFTGLTNANISDNTEYLDKTKKAALSFGTLENISEKNLYEQIAFALKISTGSSFKKKIKNKLEYPLWDGFSASMWENFIRTTPENILSNETNINSSIKQDSKKTKLHLIVLTHNKAEIPEKLQKVDKLSFVLLNDTPKISIVAEDIKDPINSKQVEELPLLLKEQFATWEVANEVSTTQDKQLNQDNEQSNEWLSAFAELRPSLKKYFPQNVFPEFSLVRQGRSENEFIEKLKLVNTNLPLVVFCTNSDIAMKDMNEFFSVQDFFDHLKVPKLNFDCASAKRDSQNPWKHRRSALVVVPLNTEQLLQLEQSGVGSFADNWQQGDTVVFLPSDQGTNVFEYAQKATDFLQLEDGAQFQKVSLASLPNDFEALQISGKKELLGRSKTQPQIFFVRVSASNKSLQRSSYWSLIWKHLMNEKSHTNLPNLQKINSTESSSVISIQGKNIDEFNKKLQNLSSQEFAFLASQTKDNIFAHGAFQNADKLFIVGGEDFTFLNVQSNETNPSQNTNNSKLAAANSLENLNQNNSIETQKQEKTFFPLEKKVSIFLAFILFLVLISLKNIKKNIVLFATLGLLFPQISAKAQNKDLSKKTFRIGWCDTSVPNDVAEKFTQLRNYLASLGTIELATQLSPGACELGASELWWIADINAVSTQKLKEHTSLGGAFVIEGLQTLPKKLQELNLPSLGLFWEPLSRRSYFLRSFFLLGTLDFCPIETTSILQLKKGLSSQFPLGVAMQSRYLSEGNTGNCLAGNTIDTQKSFTNLLYGLLTTDYKMDQMQLPELLGRIRKLGLEP